MFSIFKKWFCRKAHPAPAAAPKPDPRDLVRHKHVLHDPLYIRKDDGSSPLPGKEDPRQSPVQHIAENQKISKYKVEDDRPAGLNRHGIPVLDGHSDLYDCFAEEPSDEPAPLESPARPIPQTSFKEKQIRPEKTQKKRQVNKHGIPLFGNHADLAVFFRDNPLNDKPQPTVRKLIDPSEPSLENPDDFRKMLEDYLDGKDKHSLLREKHDDPPDKKPPSKTERLKSYPPPQEELDLHGCTAQEALTKTEMFIRNARYKGKRTLLIIVGKGIHSDGRAILPDAVEDRLIELVQKNWVLSFEWEKGLKRKSGALIVYLNTPRP
jgi:DNA-nicking Smr family endonuclease